MRIIILRHAIRVRGEDEADEYTESGSQLSEAGKDQSRSRRDDWAERGLQPAVYFTSCFTHAVQTAEILRASTDRAALPQIVRLCTLTPHFQGPRQLRGRWAGIQIFEAIDRESRAKSNDLRQFDTAVFILHKPRVEQLLAAITPQDQSRFRDLDYSEGVSVLADSIDDFLQGAGREEFRFKNCTKFKA